MKNFLIVLLAASTLVGCATKEKTDSASGTKDTAATTTTVASNTTTDPSNPSTVTDEANMTTLEWIDPVKKELGNLKKDQAIEITYRFKNTGDKPLIIENVTAQCGCTIPEKPQQPFGPGEEGVIKAKFNGVGSGHISKEVYVVANTKPVKNHTLTFSGDIK